MSARPPARCGTISGYNRHLRVTYTRPCLACCDAHAAYQRVWVAGEVRPREIAPCGTVAAWRRHIRGGERPCAACREAKRVESAANRQKARVAA